MRSFKIGAVAREGLIKALEGMKLSMAERPG
jgi:hypothetical protein